MRANEFPKSNGQHQLFVRRAFVTRQLMTFAVRLRTRLIRHIMRFLILVFRGSPLRSFPANWTKFQYRLPRLMIRMTLLNPCFSIGDIQVKTATAIRASYEWHIES
jgi:hypothetical protein